MLEDKDYIMRLVHEIVRTLIRLIFSRDIDAKEEPALPEETGEQYKKLLAMIEEGRINEAENLLLDGLDREDQAYFEMALMFYERLGRKSEEFLALHDYSGQEIVDGLRYVAEYYGYGNLFDLLSEDKGDD